MATIGTERVFLRKASGLIKEAEAACKVGDMKTAKTKAEAAIAAMK
jgi:hypothetical protein